MSDGKSGVGGAVADLIALANASTAARQEDLFDPAEFEPDVGMPLAPAPRPGPKGGRPKGSQNKSTKALRDYILSRYKHPLIVAAEFWSRTPEQIARELKLYAPVYFQGERVANDLDTGSAARLQQQYVIAALPYLAQKMPIEIQAKTDVAGLLVFGHVDGAKAIDGTVVEERSPLGGDPSDDAPIADEASK